ncbi:MAG: acyl-CoA dehydratase activase-related protein, partial [Lentisphaeria bacterium]
PFDDQDGLVVRLHEELGAQFHISRDEISSAVRGALQEFENYKSDVARKGEETLKYLKDNNQKGIVLAGRPYHMDWEVSHGLSRLVTSLGFAVLTEDSISHLEDGKGIEIVDQWVYHSRMFRAAKVVANSPNLELVQLNSFGCGLDGVTVDEVRRIIEQSGKIYTQIKIDEVSNLGAIKIRLRSLEAFTKMARSRQQAVIKEQSGQVNGSLKDDYTLLIPEMSPYHFEMIRGVLEHQGYKAQILESFDTSCKEAGLKHVNNEMCYPALLSIGQIVSHLKSGKYDVDKVAVMMSQTGGGCRASNYIVFLRQALEAEGLSQVPVVSFNAHGMDKQSIPLNFQLVRQLIFGVLYGDLLMKLVVHISSYEKVPGEGERFRKRWLERLYRSLYNGETKASFQNNVHVMVQEFVNTDLYERSKPRVGIVGEVYVKYQPFANSDLINLLIKEGAEPIVPNLYNFFLYNIFDLVADARDLKRSKVKAWIAKVVIYYMDSIRNVIRRELKECKFDNEHTFKSLTRLSENFISLSNKMGEGWLLTGEMAELIEDGVNNVVCLQPFGCLPNHVCGKGMMKPLKEKYPQANILPLDYDPEISFTNQVNRIKLMLATALEGHN